MQTGSVSHRLGVVMVILGTVVMGFLAGFAVVFSALSREPDSLQRQPPKDEQPAPAVNRKQFESKKPGAAEDAR